ncbi:MAG: hypothetical protein M1819_003827 [Sarea resinae]|nr:MAG: hypothetical protein M1819_003827 [Sarea resinae]
MTQTSKPVITRAATDRALHLSQIWLDTGGQVSPGPSTIRSPSLYPQSARPLSPSERSPASFDLSHRSPFLTPPLLDALDELPPFRPLEDDQFSLSMYRRPRLSVELDRASSAEEQKSEKDSHDSMKDNSVQRRPISTDSQDGRINLFEAIVHQLDAINEASDVSARTIIKSTSGSDTSYELSTEKKGLLNCSPFDDGHQNTPITPDVWPHRSMSLSSNMSLIRAKFDKASPPSSRAGRRWSVGAVGAPVLQSYAASHASPELGISLHHAPGQQSTAKKIETSMKGRVEWVKDIARIPSRRKLVRRDTPASITLRRASTVPVAPKTPMIDSTLASSPMPTEPKAGSNSGSMLKYSIELYRTNDWGSDIPDKHARTENAKAELRRASQASIDSVPRTTIAETTLTYTDMHVASSMPSSFSPQEFSGHSPRRLSTVQRVQSRSSVYEIIWKDDWTSEGSSLPDSRRMSYQSTSLGIATPREYYESSEADLSSTSSRSILAGSISSSSKDSSPTSRHGSVDVLRANEIKRVGTTEFSGWSWLKKDHVSPELSGKDLTCSIATRGEVWHPALDTRVDQEGWQTENLSSPIDPPNVPERSQERRRSSVLRSAPGLKAAHILYPEYGPSPPDAGDRRKSSVLRSAPGLEAAHILFPSEYALSHPDDRNRRKSSVLRSAAGLEAANPLFPTETEPLLRIKTQYDRPRRVSVQSLPTKFTTIGPGGFQVGSALGISAHRRRSSAIPDLLHSSFAIQPPPELPPLDDRGVRVFDFSKHRDSLAVTRLRQMKKVLQRPEAEAGRKKGKRL